METLLQDVRFGMRMLRKNLAFTAVAVVTVALGIGANTAIFSVVNSVLLRPLPFNDPDRIVSVWQKLPQEDHVRFSTPEFELWRSQTQVFESIAAGIGNAFSLTHGGEPTMVFGQMVTPSLFSVLGVSPRIGRVFLETEGQAGNEHVVILSHGLWKEQFGGDPNVLSKTVLLNGESYAVVGVMGPEFTYPAERYRLWVPAALNGGMFTKFRDAHFLQVIGRVKPGISDARVRAELQSVEKSIAALDPDSKRELHFTKLQEAQTGSIRKPLLVLMAAVGLVLLIACSNIANLLLARAATRQKEMAVRIAVGARRWRIARQLLVESTLLAGIGGALGYLCAFWALDALVALLPGDVPGLSAVRMDPSVLVFTAGVSLFTGILFGLAPAITNWTEAWSQILKQGDHGGGGRNAIAPRVRSTLIFLEVALSVVLLCGASLMLRSFLRLQQVDPGFNADNVLTGSVSMPEKRYPDIAHIRSFYHRTLGAMRAIPGVESAAFNTALPLSGQGWGNDVQIEGRPVAPGEQNLVQVQCVSSQYFEAMGISLKNGRGFEETDTETSPLVAIVDATAAERFWPGENPIGKRLNVDGPVRTVVGVVSNVKRTGLDVAEAPQLYLPYLQLSPELTKFLGRGLFIAVRSKVPPSALTQSVRQAVMSVDRELPLTQVRTMEELVGSSVAEPRSRALLLGLFAVLALVLACVGIYGVMSYVVTQRWREIGIRIALGAQPGTILRLILNRALLLAVSGVVAGLLGSVLLARVVSALLFSIGPYDAVTFTVVPLVSIAMAVLASLLPARQAARVDPMIALRYE